jgi:uncharacterized protein YbjT (DUF2867 family)
MEAAVAALGFESVTFFRPSLLTGERTQVRPGEGLGIMFAQILHPLLPKQYRAIPGSAVAAAMLAALRQPQAGVHSVESGQMQQYR